MTPSITAVNFQNKSKSTNFEYPEIFDKDQLEITKISDNMRYVPIEDVTFAGEQNDIGYNVDSGNTIYRANEIVREDENIDINYETMKVLELLCTEMNKTPVEVLQNTKPEDFDKSEKTIRIILPPSKGLDINKNNEEFFVDGIFYSPNFQGLAYRGWHISEKRAKKMDVVISVPKESIVEIPGESKLGTYNIETGEIKKL